MREPSPARDLASALRITTAIQIVATATVLALTTIAPIVAAGLGISAHWVGYQISLVYLSGAFASVAAGSLIARYGAVRVAEATVACCFLGLLGLATANLALIVLASLAMGIGYGLNNPASSQILMRVAPPERRNFVFSVKQAGVPIGGMLAGLLFPWLSVTVGWQGALVSLAIVPLLLLIPVVAMRGAFDELRNRGAPFWKGLVSGPRAVWADRRLRTIALLSLVYSAVQLSLSTFVVSMLIEENEWHPVAAGEVLALVQVAGAAGRLAWGHAADWARSSFSTFVLVGVLACLGAAATVGFDALPVPAGLLLLSVFAFCANGWNGVMLAETARLAPHGEVGQVTGGVLLFVFLGVVIGPSAFALLYGQIGSYALTFGIFGAVSLVAVAALLLAQRRPQP